MRGLVRFVRLDPHRRWLLVQAAVLMVATRLALYVVPLQTLRKVFSRASSPQRRGGGRQTAEQDVVWAISAASRYVPTDSRCLTRALTGEVLFRRMGKSPRLYIGVARGEGARLEAHAWLEVDGRVMIGGDVDLGRYSSFPPLGMDRSQP